MKELLAFLPITIAYLAFRSTVSANVPAPDVVLLIVFFMAVRGASLEGLLAAFVLGYIEDAFTGGVLGSSSFALIIVHITVHLASKKAHFSTPGIRAGGALFFSLLKSLLIFAAIRSSGVRAELFWGIAATAITTGVFAPAAMNLLARLSFFLNPHGFKNETQ
ncbi:MAG: rod shape-determining protein MreD [Deltaproteobacteria bacterium]|nr:rod shape-determining protein MreD [Deltaproteobacteria bacterium]